MAAALLRRLLHDAGLQWSVSSAGLLGHDGDPAEPEARRAMLAQGLNIDEHRARSFDPAMLADQRLLLCMDSGIARALRVRFPTAAPLVHELGDLAGRHRDIPDPFRMQIGAWINYAEEINQLLRLALPRLRQLMSSEASPSTMAAPTPSSSANAALTDSLNRLNRILGLLQDMPELIEWSNARQQIEQELRSIANSAPSPSAALVAYTRALIDRISACRQPPSRGQVDLLQGALERLKHPLDDVALAALQADIVAWPAA